MEFDPAAMDRRDVYTLMATCIVPRPIAWVATQDKDGINNLAPFSFFNGISSKPPSLSIAVSYNRGREDGYKDTLANILELREFVVSVVTEDTALAMVETAMGHPADVDEFETARLTAMPSKTIRPPRVGESPVSFECELHETMQIGEGPGSSTLVIGIIKHIYVQDNILTAEGAVDVEKLHIIGRVSGSSGYCYIRDTFDLSRSS